MIDSSLIDWFSSGNAAAPASKGTDQQDEVWGHRRSVNNHMRHLEFYNGHLKMYFIMAILNLISAILKGITAIFNFITAILCITAILNFTHTQYWVSYPPSWFVYPRHLESFFCLGIKRACQRTLEDWIKWAPYQVTWDEDLDEDDWDTRSFIYLFIICYLFVYKFIH